MLQCIKAEVRRRWGEQAHENIRRLGNANRIIIKADKDPALVSLRNEVTQQSATQAAAEVPPQAESQGNGCTENGFTLLKDIIEIVNVTLIGIFSLSTSAYFVSSFHGADIFRKFVLRSVDL